LIEKVPPPNYPPGFFLVLRATLADFSLGSFFRTTSLISNLKGDKSGFVCPLVHQSALFVAISSRCPIEPISTLPHQIPFFALRGHQRNFPFHQFSFARSANNGRLLSTFFFPPTHADGSQAPPHFHFRRRYAPSTTPLQPPFLLELPTNAV